MAASEINIHMFKNGFKIYLTLILNWLLVVSPKVKSKVAVSVHVQDMSIYAKKNKVIRVLLCQIFLKFLPCVPAFVPHK